MSFAGAAEIDSIVKSPTLKVDINYVLIIEWLGKDDDRTGRDLAEKLTQKLGSSRALLVQCESAAEVERAISEATGAIATRGVPVLHIEAHGQSPVGGALPSGFVGPDGRGGFELLSWNRLGEAARPLNIATKFNLVLVSAACYGEGSIMGILPFAPLPFIALVGYNGRVAPMSLRHSMVELYRGIFSGEELASCVAAAHAEHVFDTDSRLTLTSTAMLALRGQIQGLASRLGKKVRGKASKKIARKMAQPHGFRTKQNSPTAINARLPSVARAALESTWRQYFAMDEIPENADRFAIDYDAVIRLALVLDGTEKISVSRDA